MRRFDRQFVHLMRDKLKEDLEAYELAFILQYGNLAKLTIHTKQDKYFDSWEISVENNKGMRRLMAEIETNMFDSIFSVTFNCNMIPIYENVEELRQFNFKVIERKRYSSYSYMMIDISTDIPSQVIDVLVMCEKHIEILKSA